MAEYDVVRNEEKSRFEVHVHGQTAVLDYKLRGDRMIFTHTGVPEPLEGQGIGSALAHAGLEFSRENGLTVIPYCPFVRAYIEEHEEYQSLLRK